MLGGLKQNLVHNRRPHRDWARPSFECLSVSCGGTGQQWPATGAGALGAADLGVASALLEGVAIKPTIEPPNLHRTEDSSKQYINSFNLLDNHRSVILPI